MRAEILFPEVCNLYGDLQNVYYLQRCCPALEIVETDPQSRPRCPEEAVTLVFMGSTTEQGLKLAADALRPYREAIAEKVDAGQLFLATGNALDILGDAIDSDAAERIDGLGLLPTRAEYHMMQRHNSFFVGKFEDMDIVGFKSLFGHSHGMGDALFDTVRQELVARIRKEPSRGGECLDLLMVAKYLERIGDHAVNVAEWVEFSITGVHAKG